MTQWSNVRDFLHIFGKPYRDSAVKHRGNAQEHRGLFSDRQHYANLMAENMDDIMALLKADGRVDHVGLSTRLFLEACMKFFVPQGGFSDESTGKQIGILQERYAHIPSLSAFFDSCDKLNTFSRREVHVQTTSSKAGSLAVKAQALDRVFFSGAYMVTTILPKLFPEDYKRTRAAMRMRPKQSDEAPLPMGLEGMADSSAESMSRAVAVAGARMVGERDGMTVREVNVEVEDEEGGDMSEEIVGGPDQGAAEDVSTSTTTSEHDGTAEQMQQPLSQARLAPSTKKRDTQNQLRAERERAKQKKKLETKSRRQKLVAAKMIAKAEVTGPWSDLDRLLGGIETQNAAEIESAVCSMMDISSILRVDPRLGMLGMLGMIDYARGLQELSSLGQLNYKDVATDERPDDQLERDDGVLQDTAYADSSMGWGIFPLSLHEQSLDQSQGQGEAE